MVKYNRFGDESSRSRSRSRSRASSTSSSYSVSSSSYSTHESDSEDYRQTLAIISRLLSCHSLSVSDPSVAPVLQQLQDLYMLLNERDQIMIRDYLKRNVCGSIQNVIPGTVGSQLCGCYLHSSHYRDGKPSCTAGCADSLFFNGKECPDTIIHWAMTPEGPASRVVKRGNSNCRVYVDPGFSASNEQKAEYLASLGCQTISHYDSMTNSAVNTAAPRQHTTPSQGSNQAVSNSPIGQTNATAVSQPPESSGSLIWWLLIILVLIIFIAVIFYLYAL